MSIIPQHHPHDPIGRELHDLLDYEAAVADALALVQNDGGAR